MIELKRKRIFVQKTLFRFVKQAVSIARKLTDAELMQISHPAGNGVAGWKHALLHFLRLHMDATLREVLDWAEEMERVRAALKLERGEFPRPSALCKSFDRAPMQIWRKLLQYSSELLQQSGHPLLTLLTSTVDMPPTTISDTVTEMCGLYKQHFSSIPRTARLSKFAAAQRGRTEPTLDRRSSGETPATCVLSPLTMATTI